jgi:hypothetical protein
VQDPAPLPKGPIVERLVLESPLLLMALLLGAGLAGYVYFNSRAQLKRALIVAGVSVSLAIAVWITSTLVETTRERLETITREVVDATARADAPRLATWLHPDCELIYPVGRGEVSREQLLEMVTEEVGRRVGVKDHEVVRVQAFNDNERFARVQVKVWVMTDAAGPNSSWWKLEFEAGTEGRWLVRRIEPIAIAGMR